jgi:hypothetical protein
MKRKRRECSKTLNQVPERFATVATGGGKGKHDKAKRRKRKAGKRLGVPVRLRLLLLLLSFFPVSPFSLFTLSVASL